MLDFDSFLQYVKENIKDYLPSEFAIRNRIKFIYGFDPNIILFSYPIIHKTVCYHYILLN